jgi:hypothetical protein
VPPTPALPPRFTAPRALGEGAYGEVFAARDGERGAAVAVKRLKQTRGDALRRFKDEFRALAGITHRNLVAQHELVADGAHWLLVMELVEGEDFVGHVTGMSSHALSDLTTVVGPAGFDAITEVESRGLHVRDAAGVARLVAAAAELVAGLRALHRTGRLHCDVKPSNVLVEHGTGRVVILDLGMASGLASALFGSGRVAGTPSYMSPEQAAGAGLGEASDLYAVGALLYECLTGRLPFIGSPAHVLAAKQLDDAPPLGEVAAAVPPALCALTEQLLARAPGDRPDARTVARVLAELGGCPPDAAEVTPGRGRDREVAALAAALDAPPKIAFVHAAAGLGRSFVCDRLAALAQGRGALVLRSRSYPQAHVPFRALDELVDRLADALGPDPIADDDAAMLARLFPALAEHAAPTTGDSSDDPVALRQRAARALPGLLGRAAAGRPLVVILDDLHAGDDDSAPFLTALAASGAAALVVASYRDDQPSALPAALRLAAPPARVVDIALGALAESDVLAMVRDVLRGQADLPAIADDVIAQAVAEAGGQPLFALELARHAARHAGAPSGALRLDDAIADRLAALPAPARRLVATIAVAGRPLVAGLALAAGDGGSDDGGLAALRTGLGTGWLREQGGRGGRQLDVFHPRLRDGVLAALDGAERRDRHAALATAIAAAADPDPETLARHLEGAGRIGDAVPHLLVAAERAASALAFDHAALLHGRALALGDFTEAQVARLRARRAALLADAGRPDAAADEYLRAADASADRRELVRCAAEQLLRGGRIDRGLVMLGALAAEAGVAMPASAAAAAPGLLAGRLRLAVRRDWHPAVPGDPAARFPCDVAWTLASGIVIVDPVRAAAFQTRAAIHALASGEPTRVARSLVGEVLVSAMGGTRTAARTAGLVERSRALAATSGDRTVSALAEHAAAVAAAQEGRWAAAAAAGRAALAQAPRVPGGSLITSVAIHFRTFSGYYLGALDELTTSITELHALAEGRGDHNLATNTCLGYANLAWLLRDGADAAAARLDAAEASWSRAGFLAQHYYALQARVNIALWRGDGDAALALVEAATPALRRSLLLLSQCLRVDAIHLRARCLLAAAASACNPRRAALHARAAADIARLRTSHAPWARASGELAAANLRAQTGLRADGERAARLLDACDMAEYAAAARSLDGGPAPRTGRLLVFAAAAGPGRVSQGRRPLSTG